MESKVKLLGHPIHPILVCFPIAFFIGSFVFDVLHLLNSNPSFQATGYYLNIAGVSVDYWQLFPVLLILSTPFLLKAAVKKEQRNTGC